jgi:hypothetical protein
VAYLAELSYVADFLSFQASEIGRDAAVFEVNYSGEWLVEEGANGGDGEAASFGSESVDHGFETHVNFARTDDLGDIC